MRRFFTKNLFLIVFTFSTISMIGQGVNKLKITAPVGIAGEYDIQRFLWGPIKTTPLTADAKYAVDATAPVNDACEPLTNDLTGNIAFIDRGICGLADKALKAQNVGAIAVIICNTATGTPATAVGGGTVGNTLAVSVYMLSNANCVKIKAAILAGGVNVELFSTPAPNCDLTYDPDVFWGNVKGQGDFDGGLNDWTIENGDPALDERTTWYHSETGFPRSATGFSSNDIKSDSKCNGVAVLDLRALQEVDNPTLSQPYNSYTSSLISPPIDCRGKNSIILKFTMLHNRLNGEAQISFFDGTAWSDLREIATNNAVNVSAEREDLIYALPQFADKENCRVRITVNGDFYYFVLDDVQLLNKEIVDIRVNKGWVATAPAYKTPKDQVSEMVFMADIENVGNASANDVQLRVEIKNEGGDLLETLVNAYGTVSGATLSENKPFPATYIAPKVPGFYTGEYIISSNNESAGNDGNNTAPFEFEISENTFGSLWSEEGAGVDYMEDIRGSWNVSDLTPYYSCGNVYYVAKGKDYTVSNVRFGLANDPTTIDGTGFVYADLYEMEDINALSNPNNRTLVGTGAVFLDLTEIANTRNIEMPMYAPNGDGAPSEDEIKVTLKDNTTYFLAIHSAPLDASFDRYQFLQYSGTGNDPYDRSVYPAPTNFAIDSVLNRFSGSYWQRAGLDNTYEDIRSRSYQRTGNEGFGAWAVPYIEMDVVAKNSTYDVDTKANVSIFPNPAARELYIDITLDKVASDVRVELVSIDGKIVTSKSFNNVQDSRLKIDLGNVTSGSYTALIHTVNGLISKKVVVQK